MDLVPEIWAWNVCSFSRPFPKPQQIRFALASCELELECHHL